MLVHPVKVGKNHNNHHVQSERFERYVYLKGDSEGHVGGACRPRRLSVEEEDMAALVSHFRKAKCKFRSTKCKKVA